MKEKASLHQYKNSPGGKQKLLQALGNEEMVLWLREQFLRLPPQEGPAPWKKLLGDWEEDLLLLATESSPRLRYQALSVLVHRKSPIASRLIWDSLDDSDGEVRRLLITCFRPEDRQKFYNRIYRIYLRDSNWKVRKAARERIRKDFSDLFTIHPENLEEREKIHCIELLDKGSSMDHDLAVGFLMEERPGIALNAALYLEREGCLDRFLRQASLSDRESLERAKDRLSAAARCQISSFLDKKENFPGSGALCLGVELIAAGAGSRLTEWISEQVFALDDPSPAVRQAKRQSLRNLVAAKSSESYALLKKILGEQRNDPELMDYLLSHLPSEGARQLYPELLAYLKDPAFPSEAALIGSFLHFPKSYSLRDLHDLVRSPDQDLTVKKRALQILCRFREESTILFILENLPLFSREEMTALGSTVLQWAEKEFLLAVNQLFQECDGSVRKSLITLLALAGIHLKEMEETLTDADPEGRITAVHALVDLNRTASLEHILPLLHDPELTVRAETAASLIRWNREETFEKLGEILRDPQEAEEVFLSIVRALGLSDNLHSIALLVPLVELFPQRQEAVLAALLGKNGEEEVRELLRFFKEATPALRSALVSLFTRMGAPSEEHMMAILRDDSLFALRPSVAAILDATGYVDLCIAKLKHRKRERRKEAAEELIVIGTLKAWRGLVRAVKDISREIRIIAVRALEKLQDDRSEKILEELQKDPDKRVRKYTLWALEKIRAGKLP